MTTKFYSVESEELKQPVSDIALSGFNDSQLWYIWLGLDRLDLTLELLKGTDALAATIKSYGEREKGWLKDAEENMPYKGSVRMKVKQR